MKKISLIFATLAFTGCINRTHNSNSSPMALSDQAIGCFNFTGRGPEGVKSYSFGKLATEICLERTAPTVDGDNVAVEFKHTSSASEEEEIQTEVVASFTGRDETSPEYGDIRFRLTRGTVLEKEVDRGEVSSTTIQLFQGSFLIDNKTYKAVKSYQQKP